MGEMENGLVEEVPESDLAKQAKVFYLPHHPEAKQASTSTRIRPVFDASAKDPNGVSLNDCPEVVLHSCQICYLSC